MAPQRAQSSRRRVAPRNSAVYRALADDTRRKILSLLATGPVTAGAMAAEFPAISRPAVSKHLTVLREAGLVKDQKVGRERHYMLEPGPLADVVTYIREIDTMWAEALPNLGRHLEEM